MIVTSQNVVKAVRLLIDRQDTGKAKGNSNDYALFKDSSRPAKSITNLA